MNVGAGHAGVVKLLLDAKKIDINAQNKSGDTAAHKVRKYLSNLKKVVG